MGRSIAWAKFRVYLHYPNPLSRLSMRTEKRTVPLIWRDHVIRSLEFDSSLKRDHARGTVASQSHAQQPRRRRDRAFEGPESSRN